MNKQFGGTMLGVVIGGVAGLLLALLVAIYVTKVPVPFLNSNKSAVSGSENDAAEAKRNRNWDPNGPLASKAAAAVRPPSPAETPHPGGGGVNNPAALPPLDARPAQRAAVGAPSATVASVDPRVRGGSGADPLGDLARSKGADNNAEPFAYFVQAGAFRGVGEAEAQRAKLAIMGWEAQVTEREQAGRTVYRVRIGPFGRKDDADRAKDKLDDAGLQTALVRVQR